MLKVSITSTFELPNEGVQAAVLADIVDKGIVETKFGKKPKLQFTWILQEADSKGRQKRVFETFTASLNEKATLRKRLSQMGAKFTEGQKEFDVESYLGYQATLVIGYADGTGGEKYANVLSVMKPAAGQDVQIPEDFTRKQDRTNA